MSEKLIRADAKLKRLPQDALDLLWDLRNPDNPEAETMTLAAIRNEIANRWKIKTSITTVSEFYRWLKLKRRMDDARATANQMTSELMEHGEICDADEVARLGQKFFMAEAVKYGDPAVFVQMRKLALEETRQRLEQEKNQLRMKEKIEAGLDELYKEIKGNKKAEKLFNELKKVVAAA